MGSDMGRRVQGRGAALARHTVPLPGLTLTLIACQTYSATPRYKVNPNPNPNPFPRYKVNPVGRIMNVFTKDVQEVLRGSLLRHRAQH